MEEKWLGGVDIGGTTIKTFVNLHGEIIKSSEIETDKRERGQHIPTTISKSIDQKLNELYEKKIS